MTIDTERADHLREFSFLMEHYVESAFIKQITIVFLYLDLTLISVVEANEEGARGYLATLPVKWHRSPPIPPDFGIISLFPYSA